MAAELIAMAQGFGCIAAPLARSYLRKPQMSSMHILLYRLNGSLKLLAYDSLKKNTQR